MTVFFTSDTHFGHAGALWMYRRPFESVGAMDEAMVERWNEEVGPNDEVWHLGDVAVGKPAEAVAAVVDRLAGRKHLVLGNNDGPATAGLNVWASVQHYAELGIGSVRLVLCHYPFRTWNGMGRGALNLHGHSHGRLKPLRRQADVGVDAWDFRPVPLAEILRRRTRPARVQGSPVR